VLCQSWWDFCIYNSRTGCQVLPDYGKLRNTLQRRQAMKKLQAITLDDFYQQRYDFMDRMEAAGGHLVSEGGNPLATCDFL
jgi:hypothetical protein